MNYIKAFELLRIFILHIKFEIIFFVYYRLKCCANWENEKNNISGNNYQLG